MLCAHVFRPFGTLVLADRQQAESDGNQPAVMLTYNVTCSTLLTGGIVHGLQQTSLLA